MINTKHELGVVAARTPTDVTTDANHVAIKQSPLARVELGGGVVRQVVDEAKALAEGGEHKVGAGVRNLRVQAGDDGSEAKRVVRELQRLNAERCGLNHALQRLHVTPKGQDVDPTVAWQVDCMACRLARFEPGERAGLALLATLLISERLCSRKVVVAKSLREGPIVFSRSICIGACRYSITIATATQLEGREARVRTGSSGEHVSCSA